MELLELQKPYLHAWSFSTPQNIILYNVWSLRSSKNLICIAFGASGAPKALFVCRLELLEVHQLYLCKVWSFWSSKSFILCNICKFWSSKKLYFHGACKFWSSKKLFSYNVLGIWRAQHGYFSGLPKPSTALLTKQFGRFLGTPWERL